VGSEADKEFGFFHVGSYPVSLRNVVGSTQVTVCAWSNEQKETWGFPPPVKLERRHKAFIVYVWRKTLSKQTKPIMYNTYPKFALWLKKNPLITLIKFFINLVLKKVSYYIRYIHIGSKLFIISL
jgi:predicted phosphoadenosine phosphosulfate sulfurtransferase